MEIWERYSDYSHCVEFAGAYRAIVLVTRRYDPYRIARDRHTVSPPMKRPQIVSRLVLRLAMALATAGRWQGLRFAIGRSGPIGKRQCCFCGRHPKAGSNCCAYAVTPPANLDDVTKQLAERFPASTGVRISPDARTSQILIVASPAIQQQVAELMQAATNPSASVPADSNATAPSQTPRGPRVVPLGTFKLAQSKRLWAVFLGANRCR